jgi:hypothetical protein
MAAAPQAAERQSRALQRSTSDQEASARAAAHAFDHFQSTLQARNGDAAATPGHLEGYTVWRPRRRATAPPADTPAAAASSMLTSALASLGLGGGGSDGPVGAVDDDSDAPWDSAWALASVDSPHREALSRSSSPPARAPPAAAADAGDALPANEVLPAPDAPATGAGSGMEGDLLHAAAASVLAPDSATPEARGHLEEMRQRGGVGAEAQPRKKRSNARTAARGNDRAHGHRGSRGGRSRGGG